MSEGRVEEWTIPSGTKVTYASPVDPQLTETARTELSTVVAQVSAILEAHVPQMSRDGGGAPRQILVIVVRSNDDIPGTMREFGPRLTQVVPRGIYLDVLPLAQNDGRLKVIRKTNCEIFRSGSTRERAWWRFW